MAAVFSFGSFGDIVTLCQLVLEIKQALQDGHGSHAEYQMLVQELDNFAITLLPLQRIQRRIEEHPVDSRVTGDALQYHSLTIIKNSVSTCEYLLTQFKHKLHRYSPPEPVGTGFRKKLRGAMRRVAWALSSARKDAVGFRSQLSLQGQQVTQALLLLLHDYRFQELASQIPPAPIQQFVTLTDMLDGKRPIPMEHCSTREEFHTYMMFIFRQRAGSSFVRRRDYELAEGETWRSIHGHWRSVMKPGAAIFMSAVVRRAVPKGTSEAESNCCPQCRKHNAIDHCAEGSFIDCFYCQTHFQYRNIHGDNPAPMVDPIPMRIQASGPSADASDELTLNKDCEEDETRWLRRICVLRSIRRSRSRISVESIPQIRETVASSVSLSALSRDKMRSLASNRIKDTSILYRWVQLKNVLIHSTSALPVNTNAASTHDSIYGPEGGLEDGADDQFSFRLPDPHSLHDDSSASDNGEHQWLDSLLEGLEDDSDGEGVELDQTGSTSPSGVPQIRPR